MTRCKTIKHKTHLIFWLIVLTDLLFLIGIVFRNYLIKISTILTPICPLKLLTGWLCALCGGTHCVSALLSGQLLTAIRFNAFVVFAIIYIFLVLLFANFAFVFKINFFEKSVIYLLSPFAIISLCVFALLFMVGRNIIPALL